MTKCPNCGREQEQESKFCMTCGAEMMSKEAFIVEEKNESIDESPKEIANESVETTSAEPLAEETVEEQLEAETVSEKPAGTKEEATTVITETFEETAESETKEITPLKKNKGLIIGLVAAVVILAIGGFFGYKYVSGRPIDVVSDVKVKFSGYQTVGTATFNEKKINQLIEEAALKKAGISKKEAAALVKKDKEITKKYDKKPDLKKKIKSAEGFAKKVDVTLSSTTDLSNGKKVTVSVVDNNADDNKIVKDDTKKVEAKGLEELKEVSVDDLLKDVKYSFEGFDGYGALVLEENPYQDITKKLFSDISKDGDLANDDTVELKINRKVATELLKDGKKLTGKTNTTTKVSGLKDPLEVGNLEECLTKIDQLTEKHYAGITFADLEIDDAELKNMNVDMSFKIERQESYLRIMSATLAKGAIFDIQSLYKVGVTMKANGQSVSETFYAVHGSPLISVEKDAIDVDGFFIFNPIFEEKIDAARDELLSKNLDYKKIEKK